MGTYLSPGNTGFSEIRKTEYVDKTGLIGLINHTIRTKKKLTCISRPRRFGKSYAAQMLCAYFDKSCDSHFLFDGCEISSDASYEAHLNRYHVISLDISGFVSEARRRKLPLSEVPTAIDQAVTEEIHSVCPELAHGKTLSALLLELVRATKTQIIFVIDEWDAMIREAAEDHEAQTRYLNLLRGWFKNNNFTPEAVAAAIMTGILPIKKDGSQSAISDFEEYSMTDSRGFAQYVGFTEEEVRRLCQKSGRSFLSMKKWYDGYTVGDVRSVYNPYSVMQALDSGKYRSYWKKTTAAETLMTYIDMDQHGLQEDIARLTAGETIEINTDSFQNDVETFTCKDDVLTLLVHLGYLTYEEVPDSYIEDDEHLTGLARIPNEEVRFEFENLLRKAKHKELIRLVKQSDRLLADTISGNEAAVAEAVRKIHDSEYAPNFYNNEQSLRYVIKLAYLSSVDQYAKVEELPSGHGLADIVFLPNRKSPLPAIIVELKWNKSAGGAIRQIMDKNYPEILSRFGGKILLVGISYDEKTKQHDCRITEYCKP